MLHPSSLKLIEGEEFNHFCAIVSDLIASRYEDADTNERLNLDLTDVAFVEFNKNQTKLLQLLIQLEESGAQKKDIIAGLQHFIRFFDAHKQLFQQVTELAETL